MHTQSLITLLTALSSLGLTAPLLEPASTKPDAIANSGERYVRYDAYDANKRDGDVKPVANNNDDDAKFSAFIYDRDVASDTNSKDAKFSGFIYDHDVKPAAADSKAAKYMPDNYYDAAVVAKRDDSAVGGERYVRYESYEAADEKRAEEGSAAVYMPDNYYDARSEDGESDKGDAYFPPGPYGPGGA